MVCDTPSPQDASTHQIWNSYLKEYRRYGPDTKQDGLTDGQCDCYMPPKVPLGAKKLRQMDVITAKQLVGLINMQGLNHKLTPHQCYQQYLFSPCSNKYICTNLK